MTATNHALTGALIGLTVGNPWVALPAALLSHFVCDAIPHYGNSRVPIWGKAFRTYLLIDVALCGVLVLALASERPVHWLVACFAAFLATSPDFLWLRRFIYADKHHKNPAKQGRVERLLSDKGIQWFQRPVGSVVEVAWAASAITLLSAYLR